jgi:hypothetical protein
MITLGATLRSAAPALLVLVLGVGCWSWFGDERATAFGSGASLSALLTGLAAVVLQLALSWLLVLTVLVAAEPWSGHDLASYAGCPAGLRALLLTLCGAAVVGALAVPAGATPASPSDPYVDHGRGGRTSAVLDGLPVPDRTTGAPARGARPARVPPTTPATVRPAVPAGDVAPEEREVTVRTGDSLWRIARAHLPADADAATVTRTWQAIHAANRSVIGADPDLIRPGTRLRLPTTEQETR